MSYIVDDDGSQIRGLTDRLENLQAQILDLGRIVQEENVQSGQATLFGANPTAQSGGTGGGGGTPFSFPIDYPELDYGAVGAATLNLDFSESTRHSRHVTLTDDIAFAFNMPPIGETGQTTIIIDQDAVGGHGVTLPVGVINKAAVEAAINTAPNAQTLVTIRYAFGEYIAFIEGGGGGGAGDNLGNHIATQPIDFALNDGINVDRLRFALDSNAPDGVDNPQIYVSDVVTGTTDLITNNADTASFLWTHSNVPSLQLTPTTLENLTQTALGRFRVYKSGSLPAVGSTFADFVGSANRGPGTKSDYAILSMVAEDTGDTTYEGGMAFQITRSGVQEIFMRLNENKENNIDMFRNVDLNLNDLQNIDRARFTRDSGVVDGVDNHQIYIADTSRGPEFGDHFVFNAPDTAGFLWTLSNEIGMQLTPTTLEKEAQNQLARFRLFQDGTIPIAGNSIGDAIFSANRTTGGKTDYAIISGIAEDTGDATHEGGLAFQITRSGVQEIFMQLNDTANDSIDMFKDVRMNDRDIRNIGVGTITLLPEEIAPTTGDFVLGFEATSGQMRKFNVGNLGGGGGSASEPYETTVQSPAIAGGTLAIDLNFHTHTISVTSDINIINFVNVPVAGQSRQFTIRFDNPSTVDTRTITFPASAGSEVVSLGPNQSSRYVLHTEDNGVTYEIQTLIGSVFTGTGGEVFTWSANHSANSFDLIDISNLRFNNSGQVFNNETHIFADSNGNLVSNVDATDEFFWTESGNVIGELKNGEFQVRTLVQDGPNITLLNNDQTPSNNDDVGKIFFQGNDSGLALQNYASITATMDTVTAGSNQAGFQIRAISDNVLAPIIDYSGGDKTFRFSTNVDVVRPNRSDAVDLGSSSQPWKDGYFAGYMDFASLATPADPSTGVRRIFTDTATGELSVRTDAGTTVSLEAGAAGGQNNTASNLGGGEGVFGVKVGSDLQFRSLVAGTGVFFSSDANEITINTNTVTNPLTTSLDFNNNDATNVDDIFFNSTDTEITQGAGILSIRVGASDTIRLRRGTTSGFIYDGSGIEFGTSINVGFFGTTPVGQQNIPVGATLAQVVTALRNLGLGS